MTAISNRREKTAKRIQLAAVELARRDGMGTLTTEAIAREAGVSPRTFFNYYPYKEAAIAGPPIEYPHCAAEDFVAGTGRLIDDLATLLDAHLSRFVNERDLFATVVKLAEGDPKLQALRQSALFERHSLLEQLMRRRLARQDTRLAVILAASVIAAVRSAVTDWTGGQTDDLVGRAIENIHLISQSSALLAR